MSHQIDESNSRANMAYVGALPWHGLGQELTADAPIETWRREAGLEFTIEQRPMAYPIIGADGAIERMAPVSDRFAHVRNDTQAVVGFGSARFNIVQPGDILEFYRDLLDGSRFTLETAGSLRGGATVWALARSNLDVTLGGSDRLKPYLALATANDGTMATSADFTTVRIVCRNTLDASGIGRRGAIRVPHSRQFDAAEVKADLGLLDDRLEKFAADADTLTQWRLDDRQAVEFFVNLSAKRNEAGEITNERTVKSMVDKLMLTYRRGPGANLPTAAGTAWGAVNAVTNYADFQARARNAENRFTSAQWGAGRDLKARAMKQALELVAA